MRGPSGAGLSWLLACCLVACGGGSGANDSGDDDQGDEAGDDGGDAGGDDSPDGGGDDGVGDDGGDDDGGAPCVAGETECTDCIDNDLDGLTDGEDPHCTGELDGLEDSFETGLPGDNSDPKKQECFFDGDSGQCQVHTCCLLPDGECPESLLPFNPASACDNLGAPCIEDCLPVTPVGCDCYGCCTICNPETDDCADILISPGLAPDCEPGDIGAASMSDCYACVKVDDCNGGACDADPEDCILCPGQTEDDLPASCNETNECPNEAAPCETTADCGEGKYCSFNCCKSSVSVD